MIIQATLNASGYTTICSQYPLNFSEAVGYTAWQITDVNSEGVITFEKVTGSVKGGTGLLLKGEAGATVNLASVNSTNMLSGNKLVGTIAPTNITEGQYFGLSGNTFVPVSAGNVPAGKALLPVSALPSEARLFTFVFKDEESTGVNAMMKGKEVNGQFVFNLNGQRVNQPAKGMYIMNGKKVVVK